MNLPQALEALGIPLGGLTEIFLAVPVLLFIFTVVAYFVSSRRRDVIRTHERLARGIISGARKRSSGLSQEEILARLRPDTEAASTTSRTFVQFAEILLKLAKFDREKTQQSLIRAGQRDPRAMSRYIIQRGMGMLVGPVVIWMVAPTLGLVGPLQVVGSIAGILVGGIIVDVRLDKMVASRRARLHGELPVLLDLLTIYLEAGSGFDVALARSSHALKVSFPTAAAEIFYLRRELEMSIDREKTLRAFAQRVNTQTAKTFVAIVIQSERRGNAIAPALRRLARDARREVMSDIEKKAQKIPTVMQLPMFLFILPSIFASVIGPAVVQVTQVLAERAL